MMMVLVRTEEGGEFFHDEKHQHARQNHEAHMHVTRVIMLIHFT